MIGNTFSLVQLVLTRITFTDETNLIKYSLMFLFVKKMKVTDIVLVSTLKKTKTPLVVVLLNTPNLNSELG